MISAEEARQLAEERFAAVFEEIKWRAKHGHYFYTYLNHSRANISKELLKVLEDLGFVIDIKKEEEWDEDHYGKYIEGTDRTYYTVNITWYRTPESFGSS